MKINGLLSARVLGLAALLLVAWGVEPAQAQIYFNPGQVVTNFTLYTRNQWTNDAGRIFPEDTPLQLSDFAGNVVFFEFFDPT